MVKFVKSDVRVPKYLYKASSDFSRNEKNSTLVRRIITNFSVCVGFFRGLMLSENFRKRKLKNIDNANKNWLKCKIWAKETILMVMLGQRVTVKDEVKEELMELTEERIEELMEELMEWLTGELVLRIELEIRKTNWMVTSWIMVLHLVPEHLKAGTVRDRRINEDDEIWNTWWMLVDLGKFSKRMLIRFDNHHLNSIAVCTRQEGKLCRNKNDLSNSNESKHLEELIECKTMEVIMVVIKR